MNTVLARLSFASLILAAPVLSGCQSDSAELCENICECSGGTGAEEACAEDKCEDQVDAFLQASEEAGCEEEAEEFVGCLIDQFQCTEQVAAVDCQSTESDVEECLGTQIELGVSPPERSE